MNISLLSQPEERTDLVKQMNTLYDMVENMEVEIVEGDETFFRLRAELFMELPDKKEYPDYYDEISTPISMQQIKKKIDNAGYVSMVQFKQDFYLMFANAMQFNVEGSEIYEDTVVMKHAVANFQ